MQLPIPSHDIGTRGPHVAPGTFKVTLEVDGAATESRTFEVRADPASAVTLAQHKAREAFVIEVMDLQATVETLASSLASRRAAATGEKPRRGCRRSSSGSWAAVAVAAAAVGAEVPARSRCVSV